MGQTSNITHNMRVYFNADPSDTSRSSTIVFHTAITDGYLHGLYMSGYLSEDLFQKRDNPIHSVRSAIESLSTVLKQRGFGELYDHAMAYTGANFTAPANKRLDAFLTGYQIGLHYATRPIVSVRPPTTTYSPVQLHPAIFLTGENLRDYVYGELIVAEKHFLHTMQIGREAYKANAAVCQEDLPPKSASN